jgi:hypothetical protein
MASPGSVARQATGRGNHDGDLHRTLLLRGRDDALERLGRDHNPRDVRVVD